MVDSIYDSLGLVATVILVRKLLPKHLVILGKKNRKDKPLRWDDPLPDDLKRRWQCCKDELPALEEVFTIGAITQRTLAVVPATSSMPFRMQARMPLERLCILSKSTTRKKSASI